MTAEVTKLLNDYANRIYDLRDDMLFDDLDPPELFDDAKGMAVQFFLAGIAQLEMAQRMMKLAALQHKEEEQ